jgi:hypothetical protein
MNSKDRKRAQRISEYVDGLIVHRREDRLRASSGDDGEFGELVELSKALGAIELTALDGFRENLRERLPEMAGRAPRRWWLAGTHLFAPALARVRPHPGASSFLPSGLRAAAAMALLVAVGVALVSYFASTPTVSAAEILSRGDLALAQLVRPGEMLYRRWKVTERVTTAAGDTATIRESIRNEWMDGSDFGRVAGTHVGPNGRIVLSYASAREDGDLRPRVYFAPGFSNEPRGLLSIEPSRREFQEAIAAFPLVERAKLQTYLDRGYIFEPISGERRFNRTVLETSSEWNGPLPRITVSLREATLPTGTPVYVVRIVDPVRVEFRWKSNGPPVAWMERRETLRYIARDTHLSLKAEDTYYIEDGRRVVTTRELLETRVAEAGADAVDRFVLKVPDGTPVRQQSAREQLSAVSTVLRRIPALLSSSSIPARPTSAVETATDPSGRP